MARKIGRNQKCPCGSGKKYKRCCLRQDQRTRRREARLRESELQSEPVGRNALEQDDEELSSEKKGLLEALLEDLGQISVEWEEDEGDIDKLSNHALDLIDEGRFEEAEEVCRQLRDQYPNDADHLDRLARVREAQDRFREAADLYRQAEAFAREQPHYHADAVENFADCARRMEQALARQVIGTG